MFFKLEETGLRLPPAVGKWHGELLIKDSVKFNELPLNALVHESSHWQLLPAQLQRLLVFVSVFFLLSLPAWY